MRAVLITLALALPAAAQKQQPVQVFILAGQSNMEGKGFPEPIAYQVGTEQYRQRWTRFIKDGDHEAFSARYQASIAKDPGKPRLRLERTR